MSDDKNQPVSDSLAQLTQRLREFTGVRDWRQFNCPKNLVMALTGEAGELAAEFQWLTLEQSEAPEPERLARIQAECADVLIYLVQLADRLGFDPVELRRKNMIPPSALPYKTALSFTYDSGEFEKCMDIALDMADWKGFEKRRAEARKRGKLRGIGISNSIEKAGAAGHQDFCNVVFHRRGGRGEQERDCMLTRRCLATRRDRPACSSLHDERVQRLLRARA